VYRDMQEWTTIRHRVLREGVSIRQIQRETGLHFDTIKKILKNPAPSSYKRGPREKPKLGPYLEHITEILDADKSMPKKQRHTAKRIFERIREEGYTGGYTQVKEAVCELKQTCREPFMPLMHHPGDAQVDFGEALVKMNGFLRKVRFFAMVLSYSDAMFLVAYERESTETFQDGHVCAFEYFQGVPRRITYDNAKTSVSQIIGIHDRIRPSQLFRPGPRRQRLSGVKRLFGKALPGRPGAPSARERGPEKGIAEGRPGRFL